MSCERRRDRAESCPAPGFDDQHHPVTSDHRGPREQRIASLGRQRRRARFGPLGSREGLSCQQRFVDLQSLRFQHHTIGGHEVTSAQMNNVARHNPRNGEGDHVAVTNDVGMDGDRLAQCVGGQLGAVLLHNVEDERHRDGKRDNNEAANIAAQPRNRCCNQQDRHQRIKQALADFAQDGSALPCVGAVGPNEPKSLRGLGLRKATPL
jgi:hypothetical protein